MNRPLNSPDNHPQMRPLQHRSENRSAQSPIPVRFPMAETLALLLILVAGVMAIIGIAILSGQLELNVPAGSDGEQARVLSSAQAAGVLEKTSSLTATSGSPSSEWESLLQTDPNALGVFILRTLTTTGYLSRQKNDQAFSNDVWSILAAAGSGQAVDQSGQVLPGWTEGQSRIAWLKSALQAVGFSAAGLGQASETPGRLEMTRLADSIPRSGSVIFGRRSVEGAVRVIPSAGERQAPLAIRQMLLLDGQVHAVSPLVAAPGVDNPFLLTLDSRTLKPGPHRAELLVLASDGRGNWQDIGSLTVPEITKLSAGQVLKQNLPSDSQARYVEIPASAAANGWHYALSVVNPDGPIAGELFSLDGARIAQSDNRGTQWEGLRASRPADREAADGEQAASPATPVTDRIAYARLARSEQEPSTGKTITYTLAQADSVALSRTKPEQIYTVRGKNEAGLQLQDEAGQTVIRKESEVRLVEFAARLSELTLISLSGSTSFFPAFDTETNDYGLYLPAGSGSLSLRVSAREGSFASVTVLHESDSAPTRPMQMEDTVYPEPSENTLSIRVRNQDGAERIYRVHILLSPQKSGYHEVLEAFPDSYRSPLYLMHVLHPKYVFRADQTNLSFTEYIDAQAFKDRSLVDSSSVPASWVLPGSPVYDGRSWKAATKKVITYYADPRNFLNEQDIFQFETLAFDRSVHTRKAVETILAGTFMAPDHEKNPNKIDYAGLIMNAAEQANLSPLFIAAKIIQEMGRNGASPLAFGNLAGYEGAYNLYNIGSTPNTAVPNGAQINGALYALYGRRPAEKEITPDEETFLLPWTTPERAITGGAIWIARSYIAIGQDTLYLQKFDLVAGDGLYIHQYAQNIQMAWAEGRRTYNAYRDMQMLDTAFVFRIPVFLNMPEDWSPLPS